MEIIGRLTANAKRKELKDGRNVVNFSIAINDRYKPKGATEVKHLTTFVECSYWLNPAIAQYLLKGSVAQLSGSIGVRVYNNMEGQAKGSLTFHVNALKLHGGGKQKETITEPPTENTIPTDDLPF